MFFSKLKTLIHRIVCWQQRTPEIAAMTEDETTCLHCQTTFVGNYCPRCGQSASVTKRLDLRRAFSIFLDTWGMGTNSFVRVVRDLFSRPGYMIGDYLDGHRQPYLPPFKTLFVVGSLYALMILSINALGFYEPEHPVKADTEAAVSEQGKRADHNEVTPLGHAGKEQPQGKDGHSSIAKSIDKEVVGDGELSEKQREKLLNTFDFLSLMEDKYFEWRQNNMLQDMLLQHLLYALFAWWMFRRAPRRPGLNYSEQVIAQVYICSQIGIVAIVYSYALVACGSTASGTLPNWLTLLLFFVNYKQLFGYGLWGTLWRTLLQEILFLTLLFIVLYIVVMSFFIYGVSTV